MAKNQVTLTFAGDSSKLDRTFKQVGASSQHMSQQVGASSRGFKQLGVAVAAAGVAVGSFLFTLGRDSVKAFVEAEQAQLKLQDAYERFPRIASVNIDSMRALNEELAKKTRFDDDALASGQAILAQFNLTGSRIKELTPLVADYAAKTGKELPDAATTLGKAFLGNTKALKELGINFESTGDRAKDIRIITRLLRDQVGGFAEKEGKTAAGQAAILSNRFGEMKEQVGEKLLPALLKLSEVGLKTIGWIEKNKDIVGPLVAVIALVTAAQWAWNIAMTANPIGAIIVAVAAVIAVIVYLATRTRFFQTIWEKSWGGIKSAALAVWNWLKDLGRGIASLFMKIGDAVFKPFLNAFNKVAMAWNNTIGKLSWTVPDWVPVIGGNTISAPKLPVFKFHAGGKVPGVPGQEVMAVLQAGERVLPAGSNGGSSSTDVRLALSSADDRAIITLLDGVMRRNNLRLVRA